MLKEQLSDVVQFIRIRNLRGPILHSLEGDPQSQQELKAGIPHSRVFCVLRMMGLALLVSDHCQRFDRFLLCFGHVSIYALHIRTELRDRPQF